MEELSDGDIETQEASSSLLKMTRERKGFFKFEIAPILNTFAFKIFFFILATSLVFLVSVITAFVVMRVVEYIIKVVQVIEFQTYSFFQL